MPGHIIVCGDDALAIRIINELGDADIRTLQSPTGLADAEIHSARAIICASAEDALNLEMAFWHGGPTPTSGWWLESAIRCFARR